VEAEAQTVLVEIAVPFTVKARETGVIVSLTPGLAGDVVDVNVTVPKNPLMLVTVIVLLAQPPAAMFRDEVLVPMVKPGDGALTIITLIVEAIMVETTAIASNTILDFLIFILL